MKKRDWQIERMIWQKPYDAPIGVKVLVLVQDFRLPNGYYSEIAWRNDCGEWVDIPHGNTVLYWAELPEEWKGGKK